MTHLFDELAVLGKMTRHLPLKLYGTWTLSEHLGSGRFMTSPGSRLHTPSDIWHCCARHRTFTYQACGQY